MFNFSRSAFSWFSPMLMAFSLVFAGMALGAPLQQRTPRAKTPSLPPASPAIFHAGETLSYSGEWLKMSGVISAQVSVAGDNPFFGHPAWHLQARFHTRNPLRYLAAVDDQFDSYSGRPDLTGMQFEMHLHESSKSETHILRLSASQSPAPAGATQVQVLPGTRDPLGFAYYLRTINWEQTKDVRSPVYDGHRLYEVRAALETPRAEVTVEAGKFSATGISIHVFDRGVEKTDMKITVWLAQDAARTPVLLEIDSGLGSGRIELAQASPAR